MKCNPIFQLKNNQEYKTQLQKLYFTKENV